MKIIKTGQKRKDAIRKFDILIDDEDYVFLSKYYWTSDKNLSITTRGIDGKHKQLCRLITGAPEHLEVDHIDGNRLNNQRNNLRICNSGENKRNRGYRKDNKSGFKGVSWHKQRKKWIARIKVPNGKYKHLGLFQDKLSAAKAYNESAKIYHKDFAWLNPV